MYTSTKNSTAFVYNSQWYSLYRVSVLLRYYRSMSAGIGPALLYTFTECIMILTMLSFLIARLVKWFLSVFGIISSKRYSTTLNKCFFYNSRGANENDSISRCLVELMMVLNIAYACQDAFKSLKSLRIVLR